MAIPDNKIRPRLRHYFLLVHDMFLLPRFHNVMLFEDFEGESPGIVVVDLNL